MALATEEIAKLTEKLMDNIAGKDNEMELTSKSPIIGEIHRTIESVEVLGEVVLAVEVKQVLEKIEDIEERTDHYGRTIHAKS